MVVSLHYAIDILGTEYAARLSLTPGFPMQNSQKNQANTLAL